jgi:hypothetical protein
MIETGILIGASRLVTWNRDRPDRKFNGHAMPSHFLVGYFVVIFFLVYILICGNTRFHRNGLIGKLHTLLRVTLPHSLRSLSRATGIPCCTGGCRYLTVFFYLFAFVYLAGAYIAEVLPSAEFFLSDPDFHLILSFALLLIPWVFFFAFQIADPGTITRSNVESYLSAYPYDSLLYRSKLCPTDGIPVVPRSRYCRFTRRRVAYFCLLTHSRYDHYCPWLLTPIGERNHRMFLLFLVSLALLLGYFVCISVRFLLWASAGAAGFWDRARALFAERLIPVVNTATMAAICGVLVVMLGQQCYFVSHNVTQIEMAKYDAEQDRRDAEGVDEEVTNFYDNGFWENWRTFLCPPKITKL